MVLSRYKSYTKWAKSYRMVAETHDDEMKNKLREETQRLAGERLL